LLQEEESTAKTPFQFEVLTLFPEIFSSFLKEGILSRAMDEKRIEVSLYNFRKHGLGKHQKVDDAPYGGGPGMLLRVEPLFEALDLREKHYQERGKQVHKILLTPQGVPLTQKRALQLSQMDKTLLLVCGRYEGFDERIRSQVDEEISGGDFICLGGEVIAMLMIEVVARLIRGVLGNHESQAQDSFSSSSLLEHPQYTRPSSFAGMDVPEVLLSGNHQRIAQWRKQERLERTQKRRSDLLKKNLV